MGKKSFRDAMQKKAVNPTMQFISAPETGEEAEPEATATPIAKKPAPEPKRMEVEITREEAQPKKIVVPIVREDEASAQTKRLPEETKTRRLQLLLTPSLYRDVKAKAEAERMSVNELINTILRDAVRK